MGFKVKSDIRVEGIDPNYYTVIEPFPFQTKDEAYDCIRRFWDGVSGVTVLLRGDKYYVVQSLALI